MANLKDCFRAYLPILKWFVWGYIVFAGCFTFPLWSQEFPLDFVKIYLVAAAYGIIAHSFARLYGPRKGLAVIVQTFGFTVFGLLCRYLLEFGETSNTYNFTLFNILLYSFIAPALTAVLYQLFCKALR